MPERRGSEQPEPEHYVIAKIKQALASDERVNELELEVWLAGGKLFVSGTVPTPERKEAVGKVLTELVPDRTVCNEVTVVSLDREPEVEKLA